MQDFIKEHEGDKLHTGGVLVRGGLQEVPRVT